MLCKTENCGRPTAGKSKYCREHRAIAHAEFRRMIAEKSAERDSKYQEFAALWEKACQAGRSAAAECVPVPMVIQQRADVLNNNSPIVQQWISESGVCGFAWVTVHPGNCSFANWAVKVHGAKKDYYGGMQVYWVREYGQSMQRKETFAYAFAEVLQEAGIKAYANSRMD